MRDAMTSVYMVMAVWMPVTVVPTSFATVAIDTFITELSSVMRNCADARVRSTNPDALATRSAAVVTRPPVLEVRHHARAARNQPHGGKELFLQSSFRTP